MQIFLSLAPIVLILILMVGLRWGAARAGAAGYLTALSIALIFFGAGPGLIAYAHAKALILSIDVLLIIWAAFLLYRVADEAGAIHIIGQSLPVLTPERGMQALVIGWIFASFLQGVGGFGVPVAVIAPILIGIGFSPLAAVVIPSIGHGWAVTFGSLGSSFQALMSATGLPAELLAPPAALFLGIACVLTGPLVAHAADGWDTTRRLLIPAIFLGLLMGLVQYLVVGAGFWYIGAFIAGMVGLLVGIPLATRYRKGKPNNGKVDLRRLSIALSGYLALIIVTLVIQLIPGVKALLSGVSLQLQFPQVSTSLGYVTPAGESRNIVLFRHTGFILLYTSLIAYLIYNKAGLYQPQSSRRILDGTLRRVMSSSVSILSMVSMAVIMEYSGMTDTLARALANSVGALFPIVSPWIGALGAFMTGSNTNSNVVFGSLQMRTAELLNLAVPLILAAQTAGAALASVVAPTKVVVGASTAGMEGREGDVMRRLLIYTVILVSLISLLAILSVVVGAYSN